METMTINEMRSYISNRYPSMHWKQKVQNMPVKQVIAIYRSFKRRDEKVHLEATCQREPDSYHQIDMFEYLYSINEGKETHTEVNV